MVKIVWQRILAYPLFWVFKVIFTLWFRVKIKGHYPKETNSVIIANQVSTIDALLLAIFLPERLSFLLVPELYNKRGVKFLMLFAEVFCIDPTKTATIQSIVETIRSDKRCVLFPQAGQGELSGYALSALILQQSGAKIRPIRIDGTQYSVFSLVKDKFLSKLFPNVSLHLRETIIFQSTQNEKEEEKRLARELFLLLSEMSYDNFDKNKTLFKAMLEGAYRARKYKAFIEDSNRSPLTARQFVTRCFILGQQFSTETQVAEIVGLMLPTTIVGIASFFALQAYRRIPAMLNFSGGFYNLYSACQAVGIKTIYTSRQFIQTAKLEDLVEELRAAGLELRFLEDFVNKIKLTHKMAGLLKSYLPNLTYSILGGASENPNQIAILLFTSGSEGVPKGVALSHTNLLANCYQMISRVDFSPQDVFFNALPIFHCFGLTAGSIIPLLTGNRCFLYPSPLHYKIISALVREVGATIFFATDTFLRGYARVADPKDFSTLRYIFAGAEKVKVETIQHWQETFGAQVYEGYGATEASPVISLNCPSLSRLGSVGIPLPGIECRIEVVEGIAEGGRLHVRGPNIMLGYVCTKYPQGIDKPKSGWHDTGDIVCIDKDGFLTIAGRAKRFAKLGGEMVPLSAVEAIASALWPEQLHAALCKKCPRKGEQIVLFSEASAANKADFIKYVRTHRQSDLLIPQCLFTKVKIPLLSSGKIDYLTLERNLAEFFPGSSSTEG